MGTPRSKTPQARRSLLLRKSKRNPSTAEAVSAESRDAQHGACDVPPVKGAVGCESLVLLSQIQLSHKMTHLLQLLLQQLQQKQVSKHNFFILTKTTKLHDRPQEHMAPCDPDPLRPTPRCIVSSVSAAPCSAASFRRASLGAGAAPKTSVRSTGSAVDAEEAMRRSR